MKIMFFARNDRNPQEFISWDGVEKGYPPVGIARQSKIQPDKEGKYLVEKIVGEGRKKWAVVVSFEENATDCIVSFGVEYVVSLEKGKQRTSWFLGLEWPKYSAVPKNINPWDFEEIRRLCGLGLAAMPEWKEIIRNRDISLSNANQKLAAGIEEKQKKAEDILPFNVVSITTEKLVVKWEDEILEFNLEGGKLKKHWNNDGQPRMGDSAFLDAMLSVNSLNNVGGIKNLPDQILCPKKDGVTPQEYVETIKEEWEESKSHALYLIERMKKAKVAIDEEMAKFQKSEVMRSI